MFILFAIKGRQFNRNEDFNYWPIVAMGFGLMSAVLMKQQYDYRFGSLNPKNIYYNDILNRAGTRNSPFLKKRRLRKPQEVDYGFGGIVSAASSAIKTVAGR